MIGNHHWLGLRDEIFLEQKFLIVALILFQNVV